ncbi:MAG TPA: FecR domain-containing protein [Steroidobacteraceae bacterium]|nr:FecR domain-containing protein [Steroidobacteraceae bacterium]
MSKRKNEVDREACRWVLLLERGPLSTEQQRQFDTWRAEDSRHEGAFHRAGAGILHINRLAALAGGRDVVGAAQVNVTRRRVITAVLSATSLADLPHVRYATRVGERRTVVLTDQSDVTLNTATAVFVRYTSDRRDIRLVGEALFTVAKDVARPFVVNVGEWVIQAIGTTFLVRGGDVDVTHVTVSEGTVEMRPVAHSAMKSAPQRLPANHEAMVGASGVLEVRSVSEEEQRRRLAWRTGMIVFDGQPLHLAIEEMNRYSQRRLVIEDPTLAERHIVGVFRATATEIFVSTLQATLGIQARSTGDVVLLRAAAGPD